MKRLSLSVVFPIIAGLIVSSCQTLVPESLPGDLFAVFFPEAISDIPILPDTVPVPANSGDTLTVSLCAGEYESSTLVLLPLADSRGIEVRISDLAGPGTIPKEEIEPYIVKSWWQAGKSIAEPFPFLTTVFVPELLLKDDGLIRVDMARKENYLRSTAEDGTTEYILCSGTKKGDALAKARPVDSDRLLPFDIQYRKTRQLWFTFHAPEGAAPGKYSGFIEIGNRVFSKTVKVELTVHPFALAPSPLEHSLYYRGVLSQTGSVSSEAKSERQYLAEMKDMKAHGVLYPTIYQGLGDQLDTALALRAEAGLPQGTLYSLGIGTGNGKTKQELDGLAKEIGSWKAAIQKHGYNNLYIYGMDEAFGSRLSSQRTAWETTHAAGAKVFVACYHGAFERVGDLLDLAVLSGKPDPDQAKKYHSRGMKIYCYNYPQVGVESPETYRRNYGIVLWKAGYDGAMDYAYQHGFGHVWNDFDYWPWRDHNFTYPTVDGIVGTIQWEGYREAVDDVRYLETLLNAIRNAAAEKRTTALEAKKWIQSMDASGNLRLMRERIVSWILELL